jgi:hypothetical protein
MTYLRTIFLDLSASYSMTPIDTSIESPLSLPLEFYESNQDPNEEESEVELMIQLSGMVYNSGGNAE